MNVRYRKTCVKNNNDNKCTLLECQYIKQESANWGHFFYVSKRLLLETGPPFYVVIWASRKSSCLLCEGSTHHCSVILRPWVMVRPRESKSRPPALQSSALQTELILPRLSRHELSKGTFLFIFLVKNCHIKGFWPKLKRMNYTCKKCLELLTLWTSPLERVGIWRKRVLVFFSLPTPVPRVCYKL